MKRRTYTLGNIVCATAPSTIGDGKGGNLGYRGHNFIAELTVVAFDYDDEPPRQRAHRLMEAAMNLAGELAQVALGTWLVEAASPQGFALTQLRKRLEAEGTETPVRVVLLDEPVNLSSLADAFYARLEAALVRQVGMQQIKLARLVLSLPETTLATAHRAMVEGDV